MDKTKKKSDKREAEASNRQFFFPTLGESVEAKTKAEAVELLNKRKKDQEVGDDQS